MWAVSSGHCLGKLKEKRYSGSWLGTLDVGSMSLRLIFNISDGDNAYRATMDSPDQGQNDVPLGEVSVAGDSLRIDAPMLRVFIWVDINS